MNEDENRKRQRVYWRDIIQREEQKNAEEAKQEAEEDRIARVKGAKGGPHHGEEDEGVVKEIKSVDPIGDFMKMVNDRRTDRVADAISQMQVMITNFIKHSLKGDLYDKALKCLQTLREACVREDEAPRFNAFMQDNLKRLCTQASYQEFFKMMVAAAVTLITAKESPTSSIVTEEEAAKFLQLGEEARQNGPGASAKKSEDDAIMDEIE